jgi:hypothetical protein
MQSTNYSRQQYLRDVLELAKRRMSSKFINTATNETNERNETTVIPNLFSSYQTINVNIMEIIVGVGYIFIVIIFLVKLLLKTIHKFEYYYMSPSYNRFGFIVNEESDYDDDDSESETDSESLPSSPVSLRPSLSSGGKYLHLQTPVQSMNVATPKTPLPLRRSLRLKIKSELNLSAMENKANHTIITRSQTKRNQLMTTTTASSDPCPINPYRSFITTPSPHPEHDEERAFYIRYCNEKKMRNKRPEFNSPLFVRRLML